MTDWYCEEHPWATFGHDDCGGAGVLLDHVLAWAERVGKAVATVIANAPASVDPTDDPSWCCGDDMGQAHTHGAYEEERYIAAFLDNAYKGAPEGGE
jgi:hypothetical protein